MKYITDIELAGKRVFIRADLDVPIENGAVADDNRLREAAPTIRHAAEAGARVIVAGHLGRPDGKREASLSVKPVAEQLGELLKRPVQVAADCIGPEVKGQVDALKPGEVLVLENLRYHKAEEKNDPDFAKELAALADVYINNAFATAHRAHASTAGMVQHVREAGAGFVIKKELDYFNKALANPERPLLAIFGGAKVSTKLKAIRNVAQRADAIIVGGAMANTFFLAQGYEVGTSLVERELVDVARDTIRTLQSGKCTLYLPTDVIVAPRLAEGVSTQTVPAQSIPADMMALDIGPQSLEKFKEVMQGAKTIVWNGPLGAFETREFSSGTFGIVDALARSGALTVVGGGDTDLAIHERHAMDKMDFVSTAGGAFLTLLEGEPLKAIQALEQHK